MGQLRRPHLDGGPHAAAARGLAGVIQQVAVHGSHAVALGQQTTAQGVQPLAERSDEGGRTWQPVPFTAPGPGVSSVQTQASQQFAVLRLPPG